MPSETGNPFPDSSTRARFKEPKRRGMSNGNRGRRLVPHRHSGIPVLVDRMRYRERGVRHGLARLHRPAQPHHVVAVLTHVWSRLRSTTGAGPPADRSVRHRCPRLRRERSDHQASVLTIESSTTAAHHSERTTGEDCVRFRDGRAVRTGLRRHRTHSGVRPGRTVAWGPAWFTGRPRSDCVDRRRARRRVVARRSARTRPRPARVEETAMYRSGRVNFKGLSKTRVSRGGVDDGQADSANVVGLCRCAASADYLSIVDLLSIQLSSRQGSAQPLVPVRRLDGWP